MTDAPNATVPLTTLSSQLADAVERADRALVQVNGRARYPASGTVHAPDLVIAADHTLEREEDLFVEAADGRSLTAQLVGRDSGTDLAVLRVPGLGLDASPRAPTPARVGEVVLAVGRPTRHGPMASLGVVSAVGGPLRTGRAAVLEQFIRTDATPYPGFSGGPLIDATGAVLGILTTGLVRGMGLAIPIAIAARVAEALVVQGHVPRPYLGIGSQPVRIPEPQRAPGVPERGLLVVAVGEASPAARAGLLLGDIVVALDGASVADVEDLQAALAAKGVGTTVSIDVVRGERLGTVTVTIGQRRT